MSRNWLALGIVGAVFPVRVARNVTASESQAIKRLTSRCPGVSVLPAHHPARGSPRVVAAAWGRRQDRALGHSCTRLWAAAYIFISLGSVPRSGFPASQVSARGPLGAIAAVPQVVEPSLNLLRLFCRKTRVVWSGESSFPSCLTGLCIPSFSKLSLRASPLPETSRH